MVKVGDTVKVVSDRPPRFGFSQDCINQVGVVVYIVGDIPKFGYNTNKVGVDFFKVGEIGGLHNLQGLLLRNTGQWIPIENVEVLGKINTTLSKRWEDILV